MICSPIKGPVVVGVSHDAPAFAAHAIAIGGAGSDSTAIRASGNFSF
jgi:hypothetical protein